MKKPIVKPKSLVIACDRRRQIYIDGIIDFKTTFISATSWLLAFQCDNSFEPITVVIGHSTGGQGIIGLSLFHLMRNAMVPVHTVVEHFAGSAALDIFLGGSQRIMQRGSHVQPHFSARHEKEKDWDAMHAVQLAKYVDWCDQKTFHIFRKVTNLPITQIKILFTAEQPIDAKQAQELKIATDIISVNRFNTLYHP